MGEAELHLDIVYADGPGPAAQYAALFGSTGWNESYGCTPSDLEAAMASSWAVVSAYDGEKLVGTGRLLSDGVLYGVVLDMIVDPAYRGRGIGSGVLTRLLSRCDDAGIRDVLLFAARGVQDLYTPFGFVPRAGDAPGMIRRTPR